MRATDFERPRSFFEAAAALGQRQVHQRLAFLLEQVEDVVDERPGSLLHRREARAAGVVERADLAVEDAVGGTNDAGQGAGDRVETFGEVVLPGAALQLDLTATHVRERAVAVPLRLEQPAFAAGQLLDGGRQHGR